MERRTLFVGFRARSTFGGRGRCALPYDGERIVEILRATESAAANDPANEDHAVFWLVVADQLYKRGIENGTARERALAIVDDGSDLATMANLGMTGPA